MATIIERNDIYNQEYNEHRLAKATEYATEAAFDATVEKITDNIDYEDILSVQMDNHETLNTFDEIMCYNYNLPTTEINKAKIEESIRTAVIAAEDGYYILSKENDGDGGGQSFYWTPKLPYSYEHKNRGGSISTFAVNLQSQKWIGVKRSADGVITTEKGTRFSQGMASTILTKRIQKETISKTLTDAITKSIDRNDELNKEQNFATYIPSQQTLTGINDIKSPSIMFIVQEGAYTGKISVDDVALTGNRIIHKVRTLGYIADDGRKKYCYEWQGASKKYSNITYYNSPEDAAKDGYVPDHNLIYNRITYGDSSPSKEEVNDH